MPLPAWLESQLKDRGISLKADTEEPEYGADPSVGLTACPCRGGCPACDNTGVIYP